MCISLVPKLVHSFLLSSLICFRPRSLDQTFICCHSTHPPASTHSLTHSLTDPPTHSLTHSLTHPPTHSLTQPLTQTLTHAPTHSLTHSLTHQLIHSFTHAPTHALTNSLTRAPTHSLIYSLTHSFLKYEASENASTTQWDITSL